MSEGKKKEKSRGSALALGLGSAWLAAVVGALTSLWLAPYALSRMGREEYAVFLLANDVLLWLTLLDVGITGALTAKLAKFGTGESHERDRLASTGFVAQNVISLVVFLLGSAVALTFHHLFAVPEAQRQNAMATIFALAIAMALTSACKTYNAVLIANRRLYLNNLLNISSVLVRAICITGGLWLGWGLTAMGLGSLVAAVVTVAATVILTKRDLPLVRIHRSLADRAALREISRIGLWFCCNSLAIIALKTLDRVIAAQVITLASVTPLALTGRIYEICLTNLSQVANTTWPLLAELFGKGDAEGARKLWHSSSQLGFVLAFLAGSALWAANGAFVTAWVGAENYAGIWVDLFLVGNMVALTVFAAFRAALTGAQVVKPQALWRLAEGVVFVAAAIPLGLRYGLLGIVSAKFVSTLVGSSSWMVSLTAKVFQESASQLLRDVSRMLAKIALCTVPAALAGRWLADSLGGYLGAAAGGLTVFALAVPLLLLWGIDPDTRVLIAGRLGRLPVVGARLSRLLVPTLSKSSA